MRIADGPKLLCVNDLLENSAAPFGVYPNDTVGHLVQASKAYPVISTSCRTARLHLLSRRAQPGVRRFLRWRWPDFLEESFAFTSLGCVQFVSFSTTAPCQQYWRCPHHESQ